MSSFKVGDAVRKPSGYSWPGYVVSAYPTRAGADRYVVECIAPGAEGAQHIFSATQIEHGDPEADILAAVKNWLSKRGLAVTPAIERANDANAHPNSQGG